MRSLTCMLPLLAFLRLTPDDPVQQPSENHKVPFPPHPAKLVNYLPCRHLTLACDERFPPVGTITPPPPPPPPLFSPPPPAGGGRAPRPTRGGGGGGGGGGGRKKASSISGSLASLNRRASS